MRDMDIEYHFLLNVMMPTMIDHRRHEHDISLSHGCGYLNHLFGGLLNDSFSRDDPGHMHNFFLFVSDMDID